MITNSITHVVQSALQYTALIISLLLYQWIKDASSFFGSTHATRSLDPSRHILKGRNTRALIREELLILYQWVRRLRRRHKLTQEKMAEKFGVDPRTIQRWENGTRPQPRHYSMFQQLEQGLEPLQSQQPPRRDHLYRKSKLRRERVHTGGTRLIPGQRARYHRVRRVSLILSPLWLFILIALLVFLILHFWLHTI